MIPTLLRTLRDLRRGIVGWAVGVVAIVGVMAAFWPSMQDFREFEDLLQAYPEPMLELFNMEAFTTGAGFMNTELFSFMLPMLFAIFGISRGAKLIAGQEETGVLETVWCQPQPRWRVLASHAMALATAMAVLGVALLGSLVVANVAVDLNVPITELAASSASMVLFGLEFGLLSLAVGAATGRKGLAIGVSSVAAVAAYIVYVMARLVDVFDGWEVISPVQHALRDGPLGTGWAPGSLLAMALGGLLVLALAAPVLERRDIHG